MRKKRHILLLIAILTSWLIGTLAFAQSTTSDSLLTLIKTDKEDTNKVIHLYLIVRNYESIGEYEKGLAFGEQSLILAKSLGFKKGIANSYLGIGNIYKGQGNYLEGLKNYIASLKIREEIKDQKGIANSYLGIGNIYSDQGNYPEALKNYFASLKIKEQIKDKWGIAAAYNNIGVIYMAQGNYLEALKNYIASLKIREEIGDKYGVSVSRNNIGIIYEKQGNYPEALKNHFFSLKIKKEIGDKDGISVSYCNIGIIYDLMGNYPEALKNYFASLKIHEEMGDKEGIAVSFINLGGIYTTLNKTKEAETYLKKALALSIEIGNKDNIKTSYQSLAALDSTMGNYKSQIKDYKLYILYRDSIDNEETKKKNLQASMQYEFDKKEIATKAEQERLDAINAQEKTRQQFIIYGVVGVLLLVIIFSALLYKRFRLTTRQKQIIELKSIETEEQKQIIEEKHKEITDSINYAERIQRSFIATKEILDENLNDYFVLFKPKDVVSGDFYWASKLNNGNFALATADSTGHGVPGAIMSLLNVTSLEKAIETDNQPFAILNATRKNIIERLKKDGSEFGGKDGMDASLTVYDFRNNKLIVAAANNPVWIVRGIETIEIKADKMPVGKHDKDTVSFTQQEIDLQKGDVVYTLTDGFPDQFGGEKGKKFMSKNLRELLAANAHLPMSEQKQLLEKTFSDWVGNLEQVDDVTLIGVRI